MCYVNNVDTFNRKGVAEKILTENELKSVSPEILQNKLIIAWTIKESIYKILCKEGYREAFVPKNIVIAEYYSLKDRIYSGEAVFQNKSYYFQSETKEDFVYTFASNNFDALKYTDNIFFQHNISDSSCALNYSLTNYLHQNNWRLEHNYEGIPYLIGKKNKMDISITHDLDLLVLSKLEYDKK